MNGYGNGGNGNGNGNGGWPNGNGSWPPQGVNPGQDWGQPPAQQPPNMPGAYVAMPTSNQLGGSQQAYQQYGIPPWQRIPFYPTSPWYSTDPNVGYQVRFYGATLTSTESDYTVNSETARNVMFDLPCRLVAINGSAVISAAPTSVAPDVMNNSYLFRAEYTNGDKLHTQARLASTVVGTGTRPGELGGHGYNIDQGATLIVYITPLVAGMRIDITLVCLEMRGARNFSPPTGR